MGGLISGEECVSESSLKSLVFSFSLVFFAYNLNYYFINAVLRARGLVFLIKKSASRIFLCIATSQIVVGN